MRTWTMLMFVAGMLLAAGGTAHAVPTAFDLVVFPPLGVYMLPGDSLSYSHDMTADNPTLFGDAFDPLTDQVLDVDLYILFADDHTCLLQQSAETIEMYYDGVYIGARQLPDNPGEVPYFGFELEHFDVLFVYLQDDGVLDVTLVATQGDLKVLASKLILRHVPIPELTTVFPIPEPATISLVGLGALGFGVARRRRKK